ncbi:hypothetical protein SAMN05444411_1215 [Lutibacter oricola]|uniref:Uncharacterized protein n=1 Tax=Lutibacter oricola TaxID=762486 RepID=A0A1H3H0P6_9FLAO|nr:hypothetical protein [Lutibacter oricola]SDY08488.1 hypothetical protein SAMN05444411_1215 [Lutibacter oricola]
MKEPINIYNSGKLIELSMGSYDILIIGGWSVSLGKFSFNLKNLKNEKTIQPKITKWRIQSYFKGKRAKKIFSIDIMNGGKHKIEFKNQDDLVLKKSNLIITRIFEKQIPNETIKIIFERK